MWGSFCKFFKNFFQVLHLFFPNFPIVFQIYLEIFPNILKISPKCLSNFSTSFLKISLSWSFNPKLIRMFFEVAFEFQLIVLHYARILNVQTEMNRNFSKSHNITFIIQKIIIIQKSRLSHNKTKIRITGSKIDNKNSKIIYIDF